LNRLPRGGLQNVGRARIRCEEYRKLGKYDLESFRSIPLYEGNFLLDRPNRVKRTDTISEIGESANTLGESMNNEIVQGLDLIACELSCELRGLGNLNLLVGHRPVYIGTEGSH